MHRIRRYKKIIALALALIQMTYFPYPVYALTGGPSVPEVQQFTPVENKELVNLFTGDFQYQIPLMDVGGYPLTLSYSSNIGMESEASMVGLGWNLNVGAVTRDVRGLPDDFCGDKIQVTKSAKPLETTEFGVAADVEITGFSTSQASKGRSEEGTDGGAVGEVELSAGLKLNYSTYEGWGADFSGGIGLSGSNSGGFKTEGKLGLGIEGSSSEGAMLNTSASIGFENEIDEGIKDGELKLGLETHSRTGLKKICISPEITYKNKSAFGREGGLVLNKKIGVQKGELKAGADFNIGYGSPSMKPTITTPMFQDGFGGKIKVGGEVGGVTTISGEVEFSYSNLRYAKNYEEIPAYGYMYAHKGTGGRELMDVQREKGSSFSKEVPNLPMSQFAHDLYQINAQGLQMSFRPFRGDAGTLYDPEANSWSTEGFLGADVAAGDLLKIGVDIKVPVKQGKSGKWRDGNRFNTLRFQQSVEGNPLYEHVYFKGMGEATAMSNPELFNRIGQFESVSPTVDENGNTGNQLITASGVVAGNAGDNFLRNNREYRQNHIRCLTALDATQMALSKEISSYPLNQFQNYSNSSTFSRAIAKWGRIRSLEHISEITVTRTDGMRYVFGIPAYNNHITDVSFNISGETKDSQTGLVSYNPGTDNTVANRRGQNNKFEKERTPAHPYAWLLTDILSADYVDLTGNGPSPDDLGTYTKFNYSLASSNYTWRIPVEQNKAVFNEGSKTDDEDNTAHYSFGSKELWYLHSIESKNFIAEFTYSDREDAVGVQGEDGGLSVNPNQRMKKLDKIELYARASRLSEGALPILTVHFVYDYSLCGRVPNNISGGGKLTLKRVWFQYGDSEKGSRHPYIFSYSAFNPEYHRKKIDRWGSYIDTESGSDEMKSYASLSREEADRFASAWLLTRITTPTGSVIRVEYESNDYAYVQDKPAMEFRQVVGFADAAGKTEVRTGDDARDILYDASNKVYNYVQFKLKQPARSHEDITPYVQSISELYFSMNVRLSRPAENGYEKVEGFIPVSLQRPGIDYGICTDGQHGWIRLPQMDDGSAMTDKNTPENDMNYRGGVHPISKAAWEEIRDGYMHLVYNQPLESHSPEAVATALENCFAVLGELFEQANRYLRRGGHANKVKLKGAKIRLQSPDLIKFGGGARVKRITVSDEWGNMVQDPELNFTYGKEYTYTTEENINGIVKTISSGVAQYEPYIGNEENPFVVPYRYVKEKPLSVNQNLYQVGPLCQIYYPSPVIGYRRVIVKDVQPPDAPATGYAVHEFYTAKDFPTIATATRLYVRTRDIQVPPFYSEEILNATQGFCVELNNMHGVQKAVYTFAPGSDRPVSGTLYRYSVDAANPNRLNNIVQTVDPATGRVGREIVGVEYEFFADARENEQHVMVPSGAMNLDISLRGPIPVIIPTFYPGYLHKFGRLRMASFNKVIYRCGLLEEIISFDNGAQVSSRQLLRDRESGEVILTDILNEHGNRHYQLTYPARWVTTHSGMNSAYRNTGLMLNQQSIVSGTATISEADHYFRQGDEVLCIARNALTYRTSDEVVFGVNDTFTTAWVMNVHEGRFVRLIDRSGQPLANGTYDMIITRSGYRNIINAPAAKFLLAASPVVSDRLELPESQVIHAEVTEYSQHWQTYGLFESIHPVYRCSCSHTQIAKQNAVDLLGEFVRKLLMSGDYKRRNVVLNMDYSRGAALFTGLFSSSSVVYSGQLSGSISRGVVIGYNSSRPEENCEVIIRMADGTTFFPDTIIDFTIESRRFNDGDGHCDDIYSATGTITYLGPSPSVQGVTSAPPPRPRLTARVTITTCVPLIQCESRQQESGSIRCLTAGRSIINPFVLGVLGNWRPFKNYVFLTTRNTSERVSESGTLFGFTNFFTSTFPLRKSPDIATSNWKEALVITKYDNFGRPVEQKDALSNYGASLYGYAFTLQTAVASNALHGEIAYDGFEDYSYRNQPATPFSGCPLPPHFKASEYEACDGSVSHTGLYSLVVQSGAYYARTYSPHYDFPIAPTTLATYTANSSVLIPPFSPTPGKEFHLSVWIKKSMPDTERSTPGSGGNTLQNIINQILPGNRFLPSPVIPPLPGVASDGDVVVKSRNSAGATTVVGSFRAEGVPIDGWQQINGKFRMPDDAKSIIVELHARNGKTWFDDLRIQPFNSVMKTYVYHPFTLQLMATLDENNYATYYVYDNENKLVATKKETEEGIFTVQESRSGASKIGRP
ncbi:MAG: hypothetical protein NZM35_01760 [Chitinophagales bacterium]|nr:hypothetical protein [Chitinophagales bacterium]MDW8418423.1 hypothetical protein [Chitinophagales bacterium]